jgi:hypothetical protein
MLWRPWLQWFYMWSPCNFLIEYYTKIFCQFLLGYQRVRTWIECRSVDSVFIAKAIVTWIPNSFIIVKVIRHLDTEQCQQYQNCISPTPEILLYPRRWIYRLNLDPAPLGPRLPKKRSRTQQEDSFGKAKHIKEDSHCLHPTTTHNRYSALSDHENVDHLKKVASDSAPNPPPIFFEWRHYHTTPPKIIRPNC